MTRTKTRRFGITLRIALLAWSITVVTVSVFVTVIIPEQKRTFLENLESKAAGVAVSVRDVVTGAVVNEDYSTLVDHCLQIVKEDRSLEYLVITKNSGESWIHEKSSWRSGQLPKEWHPEARASSSAIGVVPEFNRRVFHYSQPFDYSGIQWGWIHVGLSLQSYDRSVATVCRRTGILALVCILLSLLGSGIYARFLVRPLRTLQSVVGRIARGDLSARAVIHTGDEVELLADSFNSMAGSLLQRDQMLEQRVSERTRELQEQVAAKEKARTELAEAQQDLHVASREAGMAEVATGVLHNVGNVLNSVNVSTTLIREKLRRSEVSSLGRLGVLLQQHQADLGSYLTTDPKGRLVPGFIIQLAERLGHEHAALQAEQDQLARNVEHIKEIVAMQQSYAQVSGFLEQVSIAKLLDDALQMNTAGLTRHGITIIRQYSDAPPLTVDKHQVLQILVNLVHNAKYALDACQSPEKRLTAGLGMNGNDCVKVTVADNGIGIPPENLTRIFSHGFTTRKGGHGFGLHSGANAAKEMGGQLTAHSEGLGRGATFTLELPITSRKAKK